MRWERLGRSMPTVIEVRKALRGSNGQRVSRALMVASGLFVVLYVLIVLLIPIQERMLVRVEMPERTKTILPEPIPEPPPPEVVAPREQLTVQEFVQTAPEPMPEPPVAALPPRIEPPKLDPNVGKAGRQRAQQATKELVSAAAALDKSLSGLSSSLSASGTYEPTRRRRQRNVRSGRSDAELASFDAGDAKSGAAADLKGVEGSPVSIGTLTTSSVETSRQSEDGTREIASGPGVFRSNASLLAVIQRYSAGIQYCYSNELKRDPTLTGKLVVTLTIGASGDVLDVTVVRNTVGSSQLASCALSQIRKWRFPSIPVGLTTFQVPFVFTPPN